ncbi:MAG TPA: radical SAM protein [Clostridiales bacterium]|nr:radical SAM protein [Clostridiales bacterium]
MKNRYIIPVFIPHFGCTNDCVFCNQRKITSVNDEWVTAEYIKERIRHYLDIYARVDRNNMEIAFYGGSFTALSIEKQREILYAAREFIEQGGINCIRISTRPDSINPDILRLLKQNYVKIIELGAQSMDDGVLKQCKRGHTAAHTKKAAALIREWGFSLGLQMMIGLPGDNEHKSINTAWMLSMLQPHFVRIYPTLVLKGTHLAKLYRQGLYEPLSLARAVDVCKKVYMVFRYHDIPVIRMGLQAADNINFGRDVVAGPVHSSFGELVVSSVYLDMLMFVLKDHKIGDCPMFVYVNPKEVSKVVGNRRSNITYLTEKFGINEIKVMPDDGIKEGTVKVSRGSWSQKISQSGYIKKKGNPVTLLVKN